MGTKQIKETSDAICNSDRYMFKYNTPSRLTLTSSITTGAHHRHHRKFIADHVSGATQEKEYEKIAKQRQEAAAGKSIIPQFLDCTTSKESATEAQAAFSDEIRNSG